MKLRKESDTLGLIEIPEDKLWGAQTQRSLENFKIGKDVMPTELISGLALIKECATQVNEKKGLLDSKKSKPIQQAAKEIQDGKLEEHFPLLVWQTGSGTQTNMNVNEVIANRALQIQGKEIGTKAIHPNDDVNRSQSSNDVFPSAMRISVVKSIQEKLLPALLTFEKTLKQKTKSFEGIVKIGRTHLMDAVPITLAQEFSAFHRQIELAMERIKQSSEHLLELPLGGTAVGTGLNAPKNFGKDICELISKKTSLPFVPAKNKFEGIATHDSFVEFSGALKTLAVSLMKMSNDIRFLASGPRSGLGELILPANEPGSSIMPGKVNPTQCEALTLVCAQVIGQDASVAVGGSFGQFQLNAFKPLIIFNIIKSINLLSDGLVNFEEKCLRGIQANKKRIQEHLENSLMLVTALNPHIGYEKSAQVAKLAYEKGISLKEAALELKYLTESDFDKWVQPKEMTRPKD